MTSLALVCAFAADALTVQHGEPGLLLPLVFLTLIAAAGFGSMGFGACDTRSWGCDRDGKVVSTDDFGVGKIWILDSGVLLSGGLWELGSAIAARAKQERLTAQILTDERDRLAATHPEIAESDLGRRLLHGTGLYGVLRGADGMAWLTEFNVRGPGTVTVTPRPHGLVCGPYGSVGEELEAPVRRWESELRALFDHPNSSLSVVLAIVRANARLFADVAERYTEPVSEWIEQAILLPTSTGLLHIPPILAGSLARASDTELREFLDQAFADACR